MKYAKTALGQDVMKTRSVALSPRLRTMLLLCDGRRSRSEVLASTNGMGSVPADLEELLQLGLIEPVVPEEAAPPLHAQGADGPVTTVDVPVEPLPADAGERFRLAYQQATQLTAELGLRGFRLQLAVEQAMNLADLQGLATRLQEAVTSAHGPQKGRDKMARFEELLAG